MKIIVLHKVAKLGPDPTKKELKRCKRIQAAVTRGKARAALEVKGKPWIKPLLLSLQSKWEVEDLYGNLNSWTSQEEASETEFQLIDESLSFGGEELDDFGRAGEYISTEVSNEELIATNLEKYSGDQPSSSMFIVSTFELEAELPVDADVLNGLYSLFTPALEIDGEELSLFDEGTYMRITS